MSENTGENGEVFNECTLIELGYAVGKDKK